MATITELKQLWNMPPLKTAKKVADVLGLSSKELRIYLLATGIATPDEWLYRKRFISYCLDGTHTKRCKYCSIVLYDKPAANQAHYHKNISGFCNECFERFKPRKYNKRISWYRNMIIENWLPTDHGWKHESTGRFLPRGYMTFFMENGITP